MSVSKRFRMCAAQLEDIMLGLELQLLDKKTCTFWSAKGHSQMIIESSKALTKTFPASWTKYALGIPRDFPLFPGIFQYFLLSWEFP